MMHPYLCMLFNFIASHLLTNLPAYIYLVYACVSTYTYIFYIHIYIKYHDHIKSLRVIKMSIEHTYARKMSKSFGLILCGASTHINLFVSDVGDFRNIYSIDTYNFLNSIYMGFCALHNFYFVLLL